jgi:hypothetical protein
MSGGKWASSSRLSAVRHNTHGISVPGMGSPSFHSAYSPSAAFSRTACVCGDPAKAIAATSAHALKILHREFPAIWEGENDRSSVLWFLIQTQEG